MKLGYIDYLNCYPFYYHMFEKYPLVNVDIVPGYPSHLNRMLSDKMLDMSPISSAAYAELQDEVVILPQFCLSSIGYVRSVILKSNSPIEELNNKTIGLSSASQTSVILLKILMENYYNISPIYSTTAPQPDMSQMDGALIIGNEAMSRPGDGHKTYDLGELWLEKTGYPVVFAIFAIRKNIIGKYKGIIESVIKSFENSLGHMKNDKKNFIGNAQERYPEIESNIENYYNLLRFDFDKQLKEALHFYFNKAYELGLLREVSKIEYYS